MQGKEIVLFKSTINIIILFMFIFILTMQAQEIIIKNNTNELMKIVDEGNFGTIQLKNGTPSSSTKKIYSVGGILYYNGNPVDQNNTDNDWTITGQNMYSNVSGFVGINNTTPTYTLDVSGDINLTGALFLNGDHGTSGQILKSNGVAPPTWQYETENISFSSYVTIGTREYPGSTLIQLDGFTENYDHGGGFNPATGAYTPPSNGLYHFDIKVSYSGGPTLSNLPTYILVQKNGVSINGSRFNKRIWLTTNFGEAVFFSIDLDLSTTDVITFHFLHSHSSNLNLDAGNTLNATTISGFRIK